MKFKKKNKNSSMDNLNWSWGEDEEPKVWLDSVTKANYGCVYFLESSF